MLPGIAGKTELPSRRRFAAAPDGPDARPSVLHVYKDFYPPVVGGIEKSIHWMCDACRENYRVRVLVASPDGPFSDETIDGVRVVRVRTFGRVLSSPLAPGFVGWLKRLDSDILHFHLPNPAAELAFLLARPAARRGRLVATYHSDIVRQRLTGALYRPLLHHFLSRARVIMPTSQTYMDTSPVLARHRDRCRVVPLGVPLHDYDETPESKAFSEKMKAMIGGRVSIVFVGVLRYYKGLSTLVDAMSRLPENVCALIGGAPPAGRDDERRHLEERAREAGLGDRVRFLGKLSDAEVVGLYRAGDVYCLPAHRRSEAFGLSQVEAMVCGLPAVTSDLPGVTEVNRDGETGLVTPPENPAALAEALGRLALDAELRRRLGENARRRAREHFSAEAMGRRLDEVYREVIGQNRRT